MGLTMWMLGVIGVGSSLRPSSPVGARFSFMGPEWWISFGISVVLILFAGIMSGLTLGLMSLGLVDLEVLQQSGTEKEKNQATKILPVVQQQHQLLVTLLLCNAVAMEALPIFLNYMFNEFVAVVLSVTFVLAFGEVIPQAVCSRHGLSIGASLIWLVKILMLLCWPISYPVGKILDHILGHNDSALFRRAQLKALVSIHGKEAGKGGELTHDETTIIRGALDLTEKTALDSMTPLESTFSLDVHTKLSGRIPVYEGDKRNLVGVLLVKSLLTAHVKAETPLTDVRLRKMPRVPSDMPLYDILNEFQKGSSHMAAVTKVKGEKKRSSDEIKAKQSQKADANRDADLEKGISDEGAPEDLVEEVEYDDVEVGQVIGIITLEDVMEELLQEEIVDETDEFVDVANRVKVAAAAAAQMNKGTLFLRAASYKNPKMGMSKQGHHAIKKVRQVEDEAMRQNRLNRLGMSGSNDLTDPLLDRE